MIGELAGGEHGVAAFVIDEKEHADAFFEPVVAIKVGEIGQAFALF